MLEHSDYGYGDRPYAADAWILPKYDDQVDTLEGWMQFKQHDREEMGLAMRFLSPAISTVTGRKFVELHWTVSGVAFERGVDRCSYIKELGQLISAYENQPQCSCENEGGEPEEVYTIRAEKLIGADTKEELVRWLETSTPRAIGRDRVVAEQASTMLQSINATYLDDTQSSPATTV